MSKLGKSEKFAENKTFSCLFQPATDEVFQKDFVYKDKWHSDVFKNSNPIVLELGCGKGEYTIALAQLYPDKNFIGIDIKGARLWKGAKYAETNKLQNVKFIRTKIDFIDSFFGKDEVSEIWITFPDPQLSRGRKRLTSSRFLERYGKFLVKDGLIHLKTDSQFLHAYTEALAVQNGFRVYCSSTDIYGNSGEAGFLAELLNVKTFYESFYLKVGLRITYLCFSLLQDTGNGIKEPDWDEQYWKEREKQGRESLPGRIR